MDALIDAHLRLRRQIEWFSHQWLESMRQASEEETDLATQLAVCSDPVEAKRLCNTWLVSRTARFISDTNRLSIRWVDFLADVVSKEPTSTTDDQSSSLPDA